MSTNPPQPPAQPPAQPPYVDPQADAEAAKRKQRMAIAGGVIVSLALIVGAFFFGQSKEQAKYDPGQPAYNAIYTAGAQSGAVAGNAQGQKTGIKEGKVVGTEQGKKSGIKQGEAQGQAQGVSEGQQQGASEALGGLTGWDTDVPYVVEFQPGPNDQIPYAVQTRSLMQPGILYSICNSGEGLCQQDKSSSSSSSSSSGSSGDSSGGSGATN